MVSISKYFNVLDEFPADKEYRECLVDASTGSKIAGNKLSVINMGSTRELHTNIIDNQVYDISINQYVGMNSFGNTVDLPVDNVAEYSTYYGGNYLNATDSSMQMYAHSYITSGEWKEELSDAQYLYDVSNYKIMIDEIYRVGATDYSTPFDTTNTAVYYINDGDRFDAVFDLHTSGEYPTYCNCILDLWRGNPITASNYLGTIRFDNCPTGNSEWGTIDRSAITSSQTNTNQDVTISSIGDIYGGTVHLTIDRTHEKRLIVKMSNDKYWKLYDTSLGMYRCTGSPIGICLVTEHSYINWRYSSQVYEGIRDNNPPVFLDKESKVIDDFNNDRYFISGTDSYYNVVCDMALNYDDDTFYKINNNYEMIIDSSSYGEPQVNQNEMFYDVYRVHTCKSGNVEFSDQIEYLQRDSSYILHGDITNGTLYYYINYQDNSGDDVWLKTDKYALVDTVVNYEPEYDAFVIKEINNFWYAVLYRTKDYSTPDEITDYNADNIEKVQLTLTLNPTVETIDISGVSTQVNYYYAVYETESVKTDEYVIYIAPNSGILTPVTQVSDTSTGPFQTQTLDSSLSWYILNQDYYVQSPIIYVYYDGTYYVTNQKSIVAGPLTKIPDTDNIFNHNQEIKINDTYYIRTFYYVTYSDDVSTCCVESWKDIEDTREWSTVIDSVTNTMYKQSGQYYCQTVTESHSELVLVDGTTATADYNTEYASASTPVPWNTESEYWDYTNTYVASDVFVGTSDTVYYPQVTNNFKSKYTNSDGEYYYDLQDWTEFQKKTTTEYSSLSYVTAYDSQYPHYSVTQYQYKKKIQCSIDSVFYSGNTGCTYVYEEADTYNPIDNSGWFTATGKTITYNQVEYVEYEFNGEHGYYVYVER